MAAFRQGLREAGFVEGRDCAVEYRWADDKFDRLPGLVSDLLRRPITVIVANTPGALAAKAATTTVPIVFATGGDPVRDGLVANLNRPGGNVTGVSFLAPELGAKHLGLLRSSNLTLLLRNSSSARLRSLMSRASDRWRRSAPC